MEESISKCKRSSVMNALTRDNTFLISAGGRNALIDEVCIRFWHGLAVGGFALGVFVT